MDLQNPLPTDVSFLGRHAVETLANTIMDVDVVHFHKISFEDFIKPVESTALRALDIRWKSLVTNVKACTAFDRNSVNSVVEVAKVCIFSNAKQWADLLIASPHLRQLLLHVSFGFCRSRDPQGPRVSKALCLLSPQEQLLSISESMVQRARTSVFDSSYRGIDTGKRRQEPAKCPRGGDGHFPVWRFSGAP